MIVIEVDKSLMSFENRISQQSDGVFVFCILPPSSVADIQAVRLILWLLSSYFVAC